MANGPFNSNQTNDATRGRDRETDSNQKQQAQQRGGDMSTKPRGEQGPESKASRSQQQQDRSEREEEDDDLSKAV